MKSRRGTLDRLAVQRPCTAAWETMQGDERKRFCAQCQKTVFDFAQMTPREIRLRLEAGRGDVCARLTHRGGRLAVLEPDPLESLLSSPSSWSERRASPIAATVVTALLGLGGAARSAESAPSALSETTTVSVPTEEAQGSKGARGSSANRATPATGAILRGHVNDQENLPLPGTEVIARNTLDEREVHAVTLADGAFVFAGLSAGLYEVRADLEGFEIQSVPEIALTSGKVTEIDLMALDAFEQITVGGAIMVMPEPLRAVVAASDLVVAALAGSSQVLSREDELVVVGTELHIEEVAKGRLPRRTLIYRHAEYAPTAAEEAEALAAVPAGSTVLAFLEAVEGEVGPVGESLFESADSSFGIKRLEPPVREAYLDRIADLIKLERRADSDPEDLVEWLVATAEDSATRDEAIGELVGARQALEERAQKDHETVDAVAFELRLLLEGFRAEGGAITQGVRPAVLGAYLTRGFERRLTAALERSERPLFDDIRLFDLVRRWDESLARSWVERKLREPKLSSDEDGDYWRLSALAERLGRADASELATAAAARSEALDEQWTEDETEAEAQEREKKRVEIGNDLKRDLQQLLAGSR